MTRKYGDLTFRLFCDLANDKRAIKIDACLPGYIYPLSHFIWGSLVKSFHWSVILDVGSNYGEFTMDALVYSYDLNTKLICFEPSESTFLYLRKTFSPYMSRVELNNLGISSEDSVRIFRESPLSSGGSRILDEWAPQNSTVKHYPVNFKTLNPWLSESAKVLVKLDVEGHELEILKAIQKKPEMYLCFFLEINQINLQYLAMTHPDLDLYIFSKFRGKMIYSPRIIRLPKFMRRYRDLYLQDAVLIDSNFADGKSAVRSVKMSLVTRFNWVFSPQKDIYSIIGGHKN